MAQYHTSSDGTVDSNTPGPVTRHEQVSTADSSVVSAAKLAVGYSQSNSAMQALQTMNKTKDLRGSED